MTEFVASNGYLVFFEDVSQNSGSLATANGASNSISDAGSDLEFEIGDVVDFSAPGFDFTGPLVGTITVGGTVCPIVLRDGGGGVDTSYVLLPAGVDGNSIPNPLGPTDLDPPSTFIVCFLSGTRIASPDGPVLVEALRPGDLILSATGDAVPVRFNHRQTVSTRFGPAERLMPVRVQAGALGHGLPLRDLTLTQDHALVIDGLLINAGALVNGITITHVPLSQFEGSYTVYHIETEAHDVILAEGTPAETFIDYAARARFDNYAEYVKLYGEDMPIAEMDRPRIASARAVPAQIARRVAGQVAA